MGPNYAPMLVKRQHSTAKRRKLPTKFTLSGILCCLTLVLFDWIPGQSFYGWPLLWEGEVFSGCLNWPDDLVGNLQLIQYSRAHAYLLNHNSWWPLSLSFDRELVVDEMKLLMSDDQEEQHEWEEDCSSFCSRGIDRVNHWIFLDSKWRGFFYADMFRILIKEDGTCYSTSLELTSFQC